MTTCVIVIINKQKTRNSWCSEFKEIVFLIFTLKLLLLFFKLLNHVQFFVTPWTEVCQASLSFTISYGEGRSPHFHHESLLKLMYIESVMLSNHLIFSHPLLLLTSVFPSTRIFTNESALLIRWPKYYSFSISPSNEYSRLISFRID